MALYLVNSVREFPGNFLTESTVGLGKHIHSIKEDGVHDWLRSGVHSVKIFLEHFWTKFTKHEAIVSGHFQELS